MPDLRCAVCERADRPLTPHGPNLVCGRCRREQARFPALVRFVACARCDPHGIRGRAVLEHAARMGLED